MKWNRAALIATAVTQVACTAISALADAPAAPSNPAPSQPMSLEQVLQHLDTPPKYPVFAVAAGKAYPVDPDHPEDAVKLGRRQPGTGVHAAMPGPYKLIEAAVIYDRMIQRVGDLTVVAPAHMVVLNVKLGQPDLYEGLKPAEALKLLLATLTKDQWAALESKQGLAASDLTADEQRHLMLHVLGGHGKIVLHAVWHPDSKSAKSPADVDVTDNLAGLHMRLMRHVDIHVPIGARSWTSGGYERGGSPDYVLGNFERVSQLNGQTARSIVPAVLKPSDVDYQDARWDARVAVQNGETLGQLIAAIGAATHADLYCDKRMDALPITLVPGATLTCRAGDALQAAALCVSGTYRKVGSAYVLTDDIAGLGTRAQQLYQYSQAADKQRHALLDTASDAFLESHPLDSIPLGENASLGISEQQWQREITQDPSGSMDSGTREVRVPFADLTPGQQALARTVIDFMKAHPEAQPGPPNAQVSPNGKIMVTESPSLILMFDGVDGTIYFQGNDLGNVFTMSNAAWVAAFAKQNAAAQTKPAPKIQISASKILVGMAQRAFVMHVWSPDDLPDIIRDMQRAGLNELLLDAFSNGTSHVMVQDSKHHMVNLVARAVHLATPHGIAVFAVADLYQWGPDAPSQLADRTILGETSAEAEHHDPVNPVPESQAVPVYVSPAEPDVARALAAVHQQLGTVRGLAGLVWLQSEPPGYEGHDFTYELGYTLPMRLGFLKKQHVDPIDITPLYDTRVDTSMPFLDVDWQLDNELGRKWRSFLVGQNVAALEALHAVALTGDTAGKKPLFVQERRGQIWNSWYGTWDSPTAPLPRMHTNGDDPYPQPNAPSYSTDPVKQAKSQSRIALKIVPLLAGGDRGIFMQRFVADPARGKWDGVVLQSMPGPTVSYAALAEADRKYLAELAGPEPTPRPAATPDPATDKH